MRALLQRYRELVFVAALIAAPLLVYMVRGRKPAHLNIVDRSVVTLTAPVEKLIVGAVGGLVDGFGSYVWLRHVRSDNLELRRRIVRQKAELGTIAEVKAENQRLRRMLSLADRTGGPSSPVKTLVAEVVAVGVSPHSHTLRIARGLRDGVALGAPVLSSDGVVGTVAQVFHGYSDVQLIVSPLAAVPALNQRTRSRSTVRGTGDITRCKLEYARRTDDLAEGDVLVTAGGAGYFPKGLHIGRVTNIEKKPYGLFQSAHVLPAVDFSKLDEVLVVLTPPEEPPPPPKLAPPAPLLVARPDSAPGVAQTSVVPGANAPAAVPARAIEGERAAAVPASAAIPAAREAQAP